MVGSPISLKLNLDEESLEVLQSLAGGQHCSLEEFVALLVRRAIKSEKTKRPKSAEFAEAPMDAFLPAGADPFANPETLQLASSFADVQTRMRFAGTPSIFRERESD